MTVQRVAGVEEQAGRLSRSPLLAPRLEGALPLILGHRQGHVQLARASHLLPASTTDINCCNVTTRDYCGRSLTVVT